ncbi:MAG: ABC transporter permease [Chloroflexia bacterium]|nr:ABC transporter permease [Chloroflexia bacterium]
MGRYVINRLAAAIPTLLLLTLTAFLLNSAARGDPATNALRAGGQEPTPEAITAYREQLGLDDPLPVRYATWLGNALQGDFGRSFIDQREVSEILGERIGPTLRLGLAAFIFTTILGVGAGLLFGLFANTWIDYGGRVGSLLLASIPSFWLALLLITYVSEKWQLLPVAGYGGLKFMILPVLALSLGPAASLMRFTRSGMIEVWRQDYVRTARSKGLRQTFLVMRHALPNALLPITTLLGLRFGQLLAGAIVIESIFAWPGMGSALISAISGRDLPVIGAYVLIAGVLFIVVNLVTDLGYAFLDPRVRLDATGGRGA